VILWKSPEDGAFLAIKGAGGASGACQGRPIAVKFRRGKEFMAERPKSASQVARSERLGKALRENLKRRKAQLRGRDAARKDDKSQIPANPRPDR
jgi:hypothetical protein